MTVRYLTQLNTKPRILKYYTPNELVFVMIASIIPFVAEILVGIPPSLLTVIVLWLVFTLIIILFRIGKPEGYLAHYIKSFYTPDEFRVGDTPNCIRKYPIRASKQQ